MPRRAIAFSRLSGMKVLLSVIIGMLTSLAVPEQSEAGEVKVAVAANFIDAANEIAAAFERAAAHTAILSFSSTGLLYTQIRHDAPFEVFLAADQARPEMAVSEDLAIADSRFTYATGRIVLFSKDKGLVKGRQTLMEGRFTKIAIANPATAPYGAAAVEAMKALGVYGKLSSKIVQGNNIAQAYQFVETGNAEVGFVALSQMKGKDDGSYWIVPAELYTIMAQDAVLLKKGSENEAAQAFLRFLKGPEARATKEKYGYGAGD